MERLVRVAKDLRLVHRFNGYIHLKSIPGASRELVNEAGLYADRLSVNVEIPKEENLKLLAYLKYTDAQGIERDLEMGTWNGRLVIIDDSLPTKVVEAVAEDTGKGIKAQDAYTEYTTYILGEGAIGFEDVGAKVPYEMVRDAKTRGGEDTLISRKRHAVSVAGVSYTKASQATNSPTNAELKTGKNWSLVASDTKAIEHKAVPIARIISRG